MSAAYRSACSERSGIGGLLWIVAAALVGMLSGCGAKVKSSPDFAPGSLRTLAVLPVEYNSKVQREKVDALISALEAELQNYGYVVLADRLVRETCSTASCPERKTLADNYLVDGFVSLDVASVSRANFLAGYYNAIRGTLKIADTAGKDLITVSHTESERGGLVFNSGQVIQGLISQIENSEEASFSRLSAKFAEVLASKLPKPKAVPTNDDAGAVAISSVRARRLNDSFIELCANITPRSIASLVIHQRRATLRETKTGQYCGAFFLDDATLAHGSLQVEARSPYGDAVRKEVSVPESGGAFCDLSGNVLLRKLDGRDKIEISCPPQTVSKSRFLVFRAPSRIGPFKNVAEIKGSSWTSPSHPTGQKFRYEVVKVTPSGSWSTPETAKLVKKEGS